MSDDIDRILSGARLRSKFDETVKEFGYLLRFIDEYVAVEESRVERSDFFDEKEICAMEKVAFDVTNIEEDLKRAKGLVGGLE